MNLTYSFSCGCLTVLALISLAKAYISILLVSSIEMIINPENIVIKTPTFNCAENTPEIYHCKDCDFKTDLTIFLKIHIQQIHLKRNENGDGLQSVEYTLQSFICRSCTFETYSSLQWLKHVKTECPSSEELQHEAEDEKILCDGSHQTKKEKELSTHVTRTRGENSFEKDQNIKWHQCRSCSYRAKSSYRLTNHVRNQHTEFEEKDLFHCDKCSYKTKLKHILKNHKMRLHFTSEDIQWLQCDKCRYKTIIKEHLRIHKVNRHCEKDTKQLACSQCAFIANDKYLLKNHLKYEHEISPNIEVFECTHCSYKSIAKSVLKRHTFKNHRPDESIKWLKCNKCEFKTYLKKQLLFHEKYH